MSSLDSAILKCLVVFPSLFWPSVLVTSTTHPLIDYVYLIIRGAGSEVWYRVYMIAPVKKFGRVGLCTNSIPNKHGGGEEGELAELAVIWCTRVFRYSKFTTIFTTTRLFFPKHL